MTVAQVWVFVCIIVGSLPYNIKLLDATVVDIYHYINLTELNWIAGNSF